MNQFTDSMDNYLNTLGGGGLAAVKRKWNGFQANTGVDVGAAYAISLASQGIFLSSSLITRQLPANSHYVAGIRMKMQTAFNTTDANGIFGFGDGTGKYHINICYNHTTQKFTINRGGQWLSGFGSVIATSTLTVAAGSTHYYELEVLCNATTGVVNFWVDGTLYVTFSGDTHIGSLTTIGEFECYAGSNANQVYLNDCYINDFSGSINNGRQGDTKVRSFSANSALLGAWKRGGVDLGSNGAQLRKQFADLTSFVFDYNTGDVDSYLMANVPNGTILGVRAWAYARAITQAGRSIAIRRFNTSIGLGANIAVDPNPVTPDGFQGYKWYTDDVGIDPNTSALWSSLANLNGGQFGFKLTV